MTDRSRELHWRLPGIGILGLCVPSMGAVQRRFKSSVYRTNIEEPKKVLTMQRTTRGQLRSREGRWEGRLWESYQPMNKNLIRGRRGGMSWHNTAKFPRSAAEVNEAVGWRRTVFLPGEISSKWRPAFVRGALASVMASVMGEKSAEAIVPGTSRGLEDARLNYETGSLESGKGRTARMNRPGHPSTALNPTGGARNGHGSRAEKESSCGIVPFARPNTAGM